jgi:Zn-dependent peptidase ImmA (M78 family)
MTALRDAADRLAWEVLVRSGVTRPPVDVDATAAAEGMYFIPAGFDAFLGGAYCGDPPSRFIDRRPFAFIGSHQHPLRQRFTKAHELAHHLIDDRRIEWVARMDLSLPQRYEGMDYHEAHEFFAASLLMPRRWVERFDGGSWRRRDVERLARQFAVTKIAAAVRVEELYGRSCRDIIPAGVPEEQVTGLYAQA